MSKYINKNGLYIDKTLFKFISNDVLPTVKLKNKDFWNEFKDFIEILEPQRVSLIKKEIFFEIAYFWGLSGNLLAIVTPDMKYSFPHPQFIMLFFGHGMLMLGIMFACICLKTDLRWSSILRVLIVTILILPIIYGLNIGLESYQPDVNYWYLMITPGPDTLLSLYPEPPWHIPYVAVTALLIFIISFIPYKWLKG